MIPLKDNVPIRGLPTVTLSLIVANGLVWFWELSGTPVEADIYDYGYYPCAVGGPCEGPYAPGHAPVPIMLVSSMFMHASWLHLIGNMLFLWIFGNNVEDAMGKVRFLVFYLLSGIAATALQTVVTLYAGTNTDAAVPNLGASGAVSGVLGGYLVLLPTASVLTLVLYFLVEVPAFLFLGVWFGFQLWEGGFSLLEPQAGGGVAFFAHIGGFVFGAATVRIFTTRPPLQPAY